MNGVRRMFRLPAWVLFLGIITVYVLAFVIGWSLS